MVNGAIDFILGSSCLLCGLPAPGSLCASCAAELPYLATPCPLCALPMPFAQLCGACQAEPPPYGCCIAPLLYRPPVSHLVAGFKYGGRLAYGRLLADELLRRLQRAPPPLADLVVPVPLHWRRRWVRGFNQAELVGDALARGLGLEFDARVLRRTRATPPQQGLDARERGHNLRGAFALTGSVAGRHVAIVDDVVTTGATAGEIARLLRAGGARSVQVWCLARTP